MSTFSERLYELRTRNGESQDNVADAIGVSRVAFTRYENGTREPKAIIALRIAQHFNVTVEQLLIAEPTEPTNATMNVSPDEHSLLTQYRSLNRQGKEYVLQQMSIASTIYKNGSVSRLEEQAIS